MSEVIEHHNWHKHIKILIFFGWLYLVDFALLYVFYYHW